MLPVSVQWGRGSWEVDGDGFGRRARLSGVECLQRFSETDHQSLTTGRVTRPSRELACLGEGGLGGLVRTVVLGCPWRGRVTELCS